MKAQFKEIRQTMVLGVPLVLAQLTTMAMALTDAAIVGRGVGTEALASMAFALSFMNIPCVGLYGIASATSIHAAHAFGAGDTRELPSILRHGVFLSFVAALGTVLGMCWIYDHLHLVGYLGQPEALIPIARPYLHYYAAAFVFMLCTGNLRAYCESQNRPWLPMYIVAGAIAANAFLDWVLVYGVLGFPKMGLPGAGLATLVCSAFQFFALLWLILRHKELHLTLRELLSPVITRAQTIRHLRIGIPTALQIGLEIASMSVVAIMAGQLGATTLAAHHITVQIAAFSFMVPLGMSFAVSIRVSQAAGAGDRSRIRNVAESAMLFALGWMLAVGACILLARHALPAIFTHDADVIAMASAFLIAAAGFQVFDGLQCTAMGALRGMKDVFLPTLIVILAYWAFEIPLAWVLCFTVGTGGMGIWISMFLALVLSATFLSMRLRRVLAAG